MNPQEFLTALWGDPPEGQVLVWTSPNKRSVFYIRFHRVTKDLTAYPDSEIYTGVGLGAPGARIPAKNRVKAHETAGIPGLWADIDVVHPVHKESKLPPDIETARTTLAQFPHLPTILVNSGHGLQAWWLFDTPWIFGEEPDTERNQANALTIWWHDQVAGFLRQNGWKTDSTHDLSRLMRVPGTTNHKDPQKPVPVTVLAQDGPRYPKADFILRMPDRYYELGAAAQERSREEARNRNRQRPSRTKPRSDDQQPVHAQDGSLVLDPKAEPPASKLTALITNDPKFKKSWDETRRDLNDSSPSGYDMAMAGSAAAANWTDQEIVNLLIARRRRHEHDLKLRIDYYRKTISKAREPLEQQKAQERLEQALEEEHPDNTGPDQKETIRDSLTRIFGVEINRVVMYQGDPPQFRMETPQGEITIGHVNRLSNQKTFRDAVATTTRIVIPMCKERVWQKRYQAIMKLCEEESVGEPSSPRQETTAWLEEYLSTTSIEEELKHAPTTKAPFVKNGHVYIFPDSFRRWIEINTGEKLNSQALGIRMRLLFADPEPVNMWIADRRTTRGCWRLPISWGTELSGPEETPSGDGPTPNTNHRRNPDDNPGTDGFDQ